MAQAQSGLRLMRSWLSLAALGVAVAALALWAYYKPAPDSRGESHALSTADAKTITRIRLERRAPGAERAETVVLEKHGVHWRMTEPVRARVDPFQIERMLSVLGARSTARYDAADASRYGVDRPLAVLTLDAQTFRFGSINKTTTEQYVATGSDVYLVSLGVGAGLPRTADALLARDLFAPDEAPKRFDLPGFTVALEEGTWAIAPSMPDVSADERNAWIDAWRRASAIHVARNASTDAQGEIQVLLKDDRVISLRILQREPELVLQRADEGIAYTFVAAVGRKMLTLPGAPRAEQANK